MFGILVGASVFLGVFAIAPLVAVTMVAILTPSIIRVGSIEQSVEYRNDYTWQQRVVMLVSSVCFMFTSVGIGGIVFVATCICCAMLGFLFGEVFGSPTSSSFDMAVLGAIGGIVWGMAAGLVCVGWFWQKYWFPIQPAKATNLQ